MSPDLLFTIASSAVMPAWLLLVVAPRARVTELVVHTAAVPLLLAALYATVLVATIGDAEGDFMSLAGVMKLFESPWGVLIGWVHYLAFDLFIGAWEVRDAARHGISHALVVPCLILTLMFGPTGLLLYLALRLHRTRRLLLFA